MKLRLTPFLLLIALLCGCGNNQNQSAGRTEALLGTVITVTAYGPNAEAGLDAAFAEAKRLEKIFSYTDPESELSQFNHSVPDDNPVRVSDDLYGLTVTALKYRDLTEGAFDPALGCLIELWGVGTENARIPEESELQELLSQNGTIEAQDGNILIRKNGARLHLGAIAKGYVGDRMKSVLVKSGVESAILNLGGNVVTIGKKPDGSDWRVGVTDPLSPQKALASPVIEVTDMAVVTSGGYERYFEQDGERYHHILAPKTGFPADSDLLSVTVAAGDSAFADAMSTALFVMGEQRARAFVESSAEINRAVLITSDEQIIVVEGMGN